MRPEISFKTFWDVYIYDWSGNKARRKRRKEIQKSKRSTRRKIKMKLKGEKYEQ